MTDKNNIKYSGLPVGVAWRLLGDFGITPSIQHFQVPIHCGFWQMP